MSLSSWRPGSPTANTLKILGYNEKNFIQTSEGTLVENIQDLEKDLEVVFGGRVQKLKNGIFLRGTSIDPVQQQGTVAFPAQAHTRPLPVTASPYDATPVTTQFIIDPTLILTAAMQQALQNMAVQPGPIWGLPKSLISSSPSSSSSSSSAIKNSKLIFFT